MSIMNFQKDTFKKSHLQLHQQIKNLEIHLTKEVKKLYSGNYKRFKKEIEEDTNQWSHVPMLMNRRN